MHSRLWLLFAAGIWTGFVHAQFVPDAEYAAQPGLAAVRASVAYNLGVTGAGSLIGIIDSGLNPAHQEFSGAVAAGYNFFLGSTVLSDSSSVFHGSHVAGTAAARRDGNGMMGVAYDAGLVIGATDYSSAQLSAAINFAVSQNADVLNNSWGYAGSTILSYDRATIDATYPDLVAALHNAVAANEVVVFANGNDGYAQPQVFGGLPYYYAELQRSWITVVASTDDGVYLTPYSNRCGVAAAWCVAAPGGYSGYDVGVYSVDGATSSGYKSMYGTSNATPFVSGAIALLAQRFPYMTAEQLTSVLLTTAKHGTDAVLSPLFGRGLIDIGKAMNGPAAFEFTFDVNTQGYDSAWSNNIIGGGGLIKRGDGVLELSGTNTFSGGVTAAGGVLKVSADANLGSSAAAVHLDGGALQIAANLSSARQIFVDAGGGVLDTQGFQMTLSGALHGSGFLQKTGTGTLTLAGATDFTGTTEIDAGTVIASSDSLAGNVINLGALVFDQSAAGVFSGNISGTGFLQKLGLGSLKLSGGNSYSGGTLVVGGVLTGTATSLQGNIANDAAVVFDQVVDGTYTGAMSGTGSLEKRGAGALYLTGSNSYSGGTMISAGLLAGNTDSLQGMISGGGSVAFNQLASGSFNGVINLSGTLEKDGSALLRLVTSGNVASSTAVNAGTLQVDGMLSSPVTVISGATLSGKGGIIGSVTIADGGHLLQDGLSGGLSVNGSLAFAGGAAFDVLMDPNSGAIPLHASGGVTISGGTVNVSAAGTYPALSRQLILQSQQSLAGQFDGVSINQSFLRGFMSYGTDYAALVLARTDPFLVDQVSGENRRQAAAGLTSAVASGYYSDNFAARVNALYQSSPALISQDMDTLSGEVIADAGFSLMAHLNGFATTSLLGWTEGHAGAGSVSHAAEGFESGSDVWINASRQDVTADGNVNAGGYASTLSMQTFGIGRSVRDDLSLGLMMSRGDQWVQREGFPDKADSTFMLAGGYVRYHRGGIEWLGMMQAGTATTETERRVSVSGVSSKVCSESDLDMVAAAVGARLHMPGSTLRISPILLLNYAHYASAAFAETGSSSFELVVDSDRRDVLTSEAGLEWVTGDGLWSQPLQAGISLMWQHALTSPAAYDVRAAFAVSPSASFEISPAGTARDSGLLRAGIKYRLTPAFEVSLDGQVVSASGIGATSAALNMSYAW